jgi:hypothetical protein
MPTTAAVKPGLPGGLTVGEFYQQAVHDLVQSHRRLKEHPLQLAVWYDTDDRSDIRLLEVLGKFPPYDELGELFTTEFASSAQFPIHGGGRLVLTLTSADELRDALAKGYSLTQRVRRAFARHRAEVVFWTPSARGLLRALR